MTRGRVLIGTSGYVYPHWRRRFYPRALAQARWLAFYATRFGTVELNNSFYRLPSAVAFRAWRDGVPEGFVFAVKASRYLTHLKRLRTPAAPLALFLQRARHLHGTLGPVLFQLPSQFHANVDRLGHFLRVLGRQRRIPGLRAAIELRHESWLTPEVMRLLREANVALCLHDWQSCPVEEGITADFVYVRRHGGKRYRGSYPRRALAEDARRIARWRRRGLDVYVYFNNDDRALAVRNAETLIALVDGPGVAG